MQVSGDMEAMASRGTTSTTSCTFTSFYSTWDGKQFADCCATSKAFAFVFCDQCDTRTTSLHVLRRYTYYVATRTTYYVATYYVHGNRIQSTTYYVR